MGFDLSNVKKLTQVGLKSVLSFGKYKGETVESVVAFDASYIMYLYDSDTIQPDDELLKLIHLTHKYLEQQNKEREDENRNWLDRIF